MLKSSTTKNQSLPTIKGAYCDANANSFVTTCKGKVSVLADKKEIYIGLGEPEKMDVYELYNILTQKVNSCKCLAEGYNVDIASFIAGDMDPEAVLQSIAEAIIFASHCPFSLKTEKKACHAKSKNQEINLVSNLKTAADIVKLAQIKGDAVNYARDLQDTPPNILYPEAFAAGIKENFNIYPNLDVKILDEKDIAKEEMNLLLAVNRAAAKTFPARVVVIEYKGNPNSIKTTALVGKGITFDSGGYCLKPSPSQLGMKFDMSGAAIVCATMAAISKLKPKVNVVAIACITENKIGSTGTLVESVIRSKSGKTVEIRNTDAEGRLVVADGMTYAIEHNDATRIIEISTLTGSTVMTFSNYITPVFTKDKKFYQQFEKAALKAQEEVWPMPIHRQNTVNIHDSKIADISNIAGTREGGASNAAAFLQEFAEDRLFMHLDIAGTATIKERLGRGVMVRTLVQFLLDNQE